MTTNNKIIDGIDVSKCNMFRDDVFTNKQLKNVCSIGLWQRDYSGLEEVCKMSCDCKNNPNCYFKQLARAKEENEKLKTENFTFEELVKDQEQQLEDYNVIIERFLMASGKSKDLTEPDEFEEVFEDIEQTYSEYEELKKENRELRNELQAKEQKIEQVKKFVAGLMFDADCTNWFERFVVAFEDWKTQLGNDKDRYKQALDEIEEYTKTQLDKFGNDVYSMDKLAINKIQDIINKAKDGK